MIQQDAEDRQREERGLQMVDRDLPLLPEELLYPPLRNRNFCFTERYHCISRLVLSSHLTPEQNHRLDMLRSNVLNWTISDVAYFWRQIGFHYMANLLTSLNVDGFAMLLITPEDIFHRFPIPNDVANDFYRVLLLFHIVDETEIDPKHNLSDVE